MITKVNRSFHETINIIFSVRLGMNESTSPDCPGKYMILVICSAGKLRLEVVNLTALHIMYLTREPKARCSLVYCITHISHNDLPEFPSAALSSIDDATASPHSSALQAKNSFCAIMLKVNEIVH